MAFWMLFFPAVGSNTTHQPVSSTAELHPAAAQDLPAHTPGVLNLPWDILHLSKITCTTQKKRFNFKRLKTNREQGPIQSDWVHTHKKHMDNNSPMTTAKKHGGGWGCRRGAPFQKLPGLRHSTASSER